ncbi:MAG: MauE/DoxX family redox-associated membrane protein [Chloroflexota bacterium]|nr:DoxX family membrane protein [Chloroflexota bacterium]
MTRLNWLATGAGIIMGLIFMAAGLGKLLNPMESSIIFVFPEFLPTALDEFIFHWLPYLEIIIGVLLITGIAARLVASLALALTVSMIANNSILLVQGLGDKPCGCFGEAERLAQLSLSVTGALYIDVVMLILGFMVLFFYQGRFFNISPWFLRRG